MSKKTRQKLFEIRKYRAVWAIKSPFTGQIIPAGNIGNVTYLVEYRGIRKYHGQYDAYVEAAYLAALEALPEGERQKQGTMHLVVLPTEQLNEQLNGSTND